MKLWIVGKNKSYDNLEWELQGVFSSIELAEKECPDMWYFIGPANLDEPFPHETTEWPGIYRPNLTSDIL